MRAYIPWGLFPIASASFASGAAASTVHWDYMAGVITAENVNNPVGNIDRNVSVVGRGRQRFGEPRDRRDFVQSRRARDQRTGVPRYAGSGQRSRGYARLQPRRADAGRSRYGQGGPNKRGDARFSGRIQNVPEDCDNPLFLIRIATPAGAAGKWIATGAERF